MNPLDKELRQRAGEACADGSLEEKLKKVARRHGGLRKFRVAELGNFEELRLRLNRIKEEVLSDHEGYLARLMERVEELGGRAYMARDAESARRIIRDIARNGNVKLVVKSKSMTGEEVGITGALEQDGIEVVETDLGEYIIQLAGQRPSHIVTPAIHMSKTDVARLFHEKLGMELTEDPEELTMRARRVLREKFLAADMGITGANALIAENGALALVENEGNIRLTTTLPRIHVALVGIEKLLPAMDDLALHLKLLPRCATGQKMPGYVSVIRGPARNDEPDGAVEFHLVLLDNNRSSLARDPLLREALKCIRCGGCLNACPVYQHVGGHAYGTVYPGPIGSAISMAMRDPGASFALPFMSSLCGACTEACPAGIPLHRILLELRERVNKTDDSAGGWAEKAAFRLWSEAWKSPAGYELTNRLLAAAINVWARDDAVKSLPPPGGAWTRQRDFPPPAKNTFHEIWRTRQKKSPAPGSDPAEISPPPMPPEGKGPGPFPSSPRPGDPGKFASEMKLMRGETIVVDGPDEARTALRQTLERFAGSAMVKWDHPDLDELSLDHVAAELGISLAGPRGDKNDIIKAAAKARAGVTAADFGLADSATLVLITGPARPRSFSLLPEVHVALLRKDLLFRDNDDLPAALKNFGGSSLRGATLVSAPSMTGDIEMTPVFGVHGPRALIVIIW